jgi:molybdopterin adenylyltransferase
MTKERKPIRVAILTASDRGSKGEREDTSAGEIRRMVEETGAVVVDYAIVPDDRAGIASALRRLSDSGKADLVLTTGGTGFSPRDVTPEATGDVIERAVPGIPEAMRAATVALTPLAMLSRSIAGIRGRTLIVNLPGSPKAVRECLAVILPVLVHAVDILQGDSRDHEA